MMVEDGVEDGGEGKDEMMEDAAGGAGGEGERREKEGGGTGSRGEGGGGWKKMKKAKLEDEFWAVHARSIKLIEKMQRDGVPVFPFAPFKATVEAVGDQQNLEWSCAAINFLREGVERHLVLLLERAICTKIYKGVSLIPGKFAITPQDLSIVLRIWRSECLDLRTVQE